MRVTANAVDSADGSVFASRSGLTDENNGATTPLTSGRADKTRPLVFGELPARAQRERELTRHLLVSLPDYTTLARVRLARIHQLIT